MQFLIVFYQLLKLTTLYRAWKALQGYYLFKPQENVSHRCFPWFYLLLKGALGNGMKINKNPGGGGAGGTHSFGAQNFQLAA